MMQCARVAYLDIYFRTPMTTVFLKLLVHRSFLVCILFPGQRTHSSYQEAVGQRGGCVGERGQNKGLGHCSSSSSCSPPAR